MLKNIDLSCISCILHARCSNLGDAGEKESDSCVCPFLFHLNIEGWLQKEQFSPIKLNSTYTEKDVYEKERGLGWSSDDRREIGR